jgi:hypothetical protein
MMRNVVSLVVLALAGTGAVVAQPATTLGEGLDAAVSAGRTLHAHERAQRVAEEAGRQSRDFRRDRDVVMALNTEVGDVIEVEFIAEQGGQPVVAYRARTRLDGSLLSAPVALQTPQRLAPEREPAYRAWRRAAGYPLQRCGDEERILVFPGTATGEDGWHAYVLPGPGGRRGMGLAGSHRLEFVGGSGIARARAFSAGCEDLQEPRRGGVVEAEHRLDPQPTEMHVLLHLRSGLPLEVTTNGGSRWRVDAGGIRPLAD